MNNEKKGLRFVGTVAEFREWLYKEILKVAKDYKEEADDDFITKK